MRIEPGYGLEGVLPDGRCGGIIRTIMGPDLSANRFGTVFSGRAGGGGRDRAGAWCHADRGGGVVPPPIQQSGPPSIVLLILLILPSVSGIHLQPGHARAAGMERLVWPPGRLVWSRGGGFGGMGGMGGTGGSRGGFGGFGGFGGGMSGGGGASGRF